MTVLLFALIVLCAIGSNIFKNLFAKGEECTEGDNCVYNIIACAIGAPLSMIGHGITAVSGFTVLMALCFGTSMAFVAIFTIKALRNGPMAITVLFANFAMVIPILFGFFFWHEGVTFLKVFGIIIMFLAVYLLIAPGREEVAANIKKASRKWAFYSVIYGVSTGLMSLFQQVQTKTVPAENSMFLILGFTFASLALCVYLPFCQKKAEMKVTKKLLSRENLNGLIVGIFGGVTHIITVSLLLMMDSTVFYPLKAGICIICDMMAGYFLFHEKISRRKLIGFAIGGVSIVLLTIVK
ncbi:MAG: hypothetical protein MJ059_07315 [Lachnospiraceae bacterium]|nr:hypothetical protein [Lachnospiraceae bacterium]